MTDKKDDVIEIDLLRLMRAIWRWVWAVVLAAIVCGGAVLAGTIFLITPQYEASVLMYVNSSDISVGGAKLSISQGDLMAAQSLVSTYTVILNTRTTLDEVIEEAGLTDTYETLVEKLSAESVNDTEVFRITVTDPSPSQAALIANTIAQILPEKIASIVEGSSARIVDMAVVPVSPSSPSYVKNTIIGVMVGILLSCGMIVIQELRDDKIYDTDYLIQMYDLPILATIPDLLQKKENGSSYYYSYGAPKSQNSDKR